MNHVSLGHRCSDGCTAYMCHRTVANVYNLVKIMRVNEVEVVLF